jgi:two-component system sensor histidine kinase AlgZ
MACIPHAVSYSYSTMSNKLSFSSTYADDSDLLPNFCDVRVIFMLVLLVELLALALSSIPTSINFWDQLAYISMTMQWIGLINAAILCSLRQRLNLMPNRINIASSFCLMMLVSLGVGYLIIATLRWVGLDDFTSPLGEHFILRITLLSSAVYAVVLRYFYMQQQWKLHLQAHLKAEIQALRARIRPHFLFNSMNTIASLIAISPEKAEKAVEDLSDLFRSSLNEQDHNTLGDELKLTRSYLDIEILRLGERLQIEWQIDSSLEDTEIPALCLQPLVENAIYHGIEPLPEGGLITISANQEGQKLTLKVKNPRGEEKISLHKGNRIALENIKQRLQLVYGNEAEFNINETKSEYLITLKIPLDTAA